MGSNMDGFWAISGKAAALLGGIWTAIQLYKHFFSKKHHVTYDVTKVNGVIPPIEDRINRWVDENLVSNVPYSLQKMLVDNNLTSVQIDEIFGQTISTAAERLKKSSEFRLLPEIPKRLVRIVVKNSGKRSAKRVVIDLGKIPDAHIFDSDELKVDGTALRLDELRPGQSVTANVWFSDWNFADVAVSHDDHLVENPFSVTTQGIVARFVDFFLTPPIIFIALPVFLFLLFFLYSRAYSSGYNTRASESVNHSPVIQSSPRAKL
jgi:hypothetical protein